MNLSEHFTVEEFEASDTADRNGIPNHMPTQYVHRAIELAENVLEPIRAQFGITRITSGYRSESLNRLIGGSRNSQHTLCEAADIKIKGVSSYDVCKWIMDEGIEVDQLINEFGRWTHVSFSTRHENRMDVRTAVREDGMTVYHKGLMEV